MDMLSFDATNEELLRREIELLRERSTADIARLTNALKGVILERDVLHQLLKDEIQFRREPLEALLAETSRSLFEQRQQFRSIVGVMALQRDWGKEWAVQCQENSRLREALERSMIVQ